MKPIDVEAIRLDLDFGLPAQHIEDWSGERVGMLFHLLSVRGQYALSVRLAKAALGVRA